jgi:hypothetical protein
MDTIDKVSEESLRRIGWTITMVVLKLANADQRTAVELASLACSRGSGRIAEASAKASQDLHAAVDGPKGKDKVQELARLVKNDRSRVEHIVRREQDAVRSVRRLGTSKELEGFLDKLVEDLSAAGERELAGLERTVRIIERSLGRKIPTVARETKAERESMKLVPKRRFRGTLPWSLLPESLDEEGTKAYEKIEEIDSEFMSKTAEIVNYMDGKRTVYEITEALSAEYGPTNHAHVMRYMRDLEKMRLITLMPSPAE